MFAIAYDEQISLQDLPVVTRDRLNGMTKEPIKSSIGR